MSYGSEFRLTLFTNQPEVASGAGRGGVDRIGLDLERIGKRARQPSGVSWVSDHVEPDLSAVYEVIAPEQRFVRCNPVHDELEGEIDRLIQAGARTIMLPMFRRVADAERFAEAIGGRANAVLLAETKDAAASVTELAHIPGVSEIHVGLNDLHMDLGLGSHFELLTSRYMESLCARLRDTGLPFAFGGIGRALDDSLPVPADLVYAQYPRLGATGALISRVFHGRRGVELDWAEEIRRARQRLDEWHAASPEEWQTARRELAEMTAG